MRLSPMLATPASVAQLRGGEWSHEFKWDGIRVLFMVDEQGHRLMTRNDNDVAVAWPELAPLAASLAPGTVLDGEVVVLGADLAPDFSRVAHRMHVRNPIRVTELRRIHPGQFMAFDLLHVDGTSVLDLPLERRRARLAEVVPDGASWAVPPAVDDLDTILAVVDERNLEGIVSKRRGSRYEPGVRSRAWRKLRRVRELDAVVVGHRGVDGAGHGPVGSLAVARWDPDAGEWVSLGSVGSGLTRAEGMRLWDLLEADSPSVPVVGLAADFRPADPRVVVRVSYLEASSQGQLRHPVYKGQRVDVAAHDVTDRP